MPSYYDDNYGYWDGMDDQEMMEFYHQTQKKSVWKVCEQCGRQVKLRLDYAICTTCADQNERFGGY